jgi:DNA polymerase-3 subunit beta
VKVTVATKPLVDSLAAGSKIVERRNTIPILSNVCLETVGEKLKLRVTDLDMVLTDHVEASIEKAGGTTVQCQTFYEILRKMKSETVVLEDDSSGVLHVAGGKSKFKLQSLPTVDFPDITEGNMEFSLTLTGAELEEKLDCVAFAMSAEEVRYYLNGIFVHDAGVGMLRFVATNGHQLGRMTLEDKIGREDKPPPIIIPKKMAHEILSFCKRAGKSEIRLDYSDTKVAISYGNQRLLSKLIDGTFPDYNRVIPNPGDMKKVVVEAEELADAVDRVATVSSSSGRAVKLNIEPGKIALQVADVDHGTGSDEIDASYDGPPIEIGFNHRYLTDMLKLLGGRVEILVQDAGGPCILRPFDQVEPLLVLMPMRI